ncbi:hypothetical protein IJI79_00480 [Candidatus Saccharibacteria bacterium]|nr:hypothetical protein [Candidatus Saccharibacteria bacterium]MBR0423971.1 hypothetical protein [Candidatus Saccharibacteria bacterium]
MGTNVTKVVKDFFTAIIGVEVELAQKSQFKEYDKLLFGQVFGKNDIVVKAARLPNYRYAYWVYIPSDDPQPCWTEIEVHDKAEIYNESTGESAITWQTEKLRYSEIMKIKHQLEMHKKEKLTLSNAEQIYILGPAKKLDDLSAKIAYGLAPSK